MFNGAIQFNSDLSKWDVSRVTVRGSCSNVVGSGHLCVISSVATVSWWKMLTVHVVVLFLGPAGDPQIMLGMFMRSRLDADLSKWNVQPTARVAGMFTRAPLSDCNKRAIASASTWSNVQQPSQGNATAPLRSRRSCEPEPGGTRGFDAHARARARALSPSLSRSFGVWHVS